MKYLMIFLLLLCSCAPMPGPSLFPGLTEATPLEQVDVRITVGVTDASAVCNRNLVNEGKYGLVVLNCLTNACVVTGCSTVYWNKEGKTYRCDVYAAWDADFILQHELEHCKGYADKMY